MGQTVPFQFQAYTDSPIAFIGVTPTTVRQGSDRREFLTIRNESNKGVIGLIIEQAVPNDSQRKIVALEQISVLMRPGEKKRLSVSVLDVWNRIQAGARDGTAAGRPIISIVAVEFVDGSVWDAPSDREHGKT